MKRILPLLVALSATPAAYAAPEATEPAAPPAAPTPDIMAAPTVMPPRQSPFEPAAANLLDEAAAAYAHLEGLSMHYAAFDQSDTKTTTASGTIAFSRPDKVKLDVKLGKDNLLMVTEGEKIYGQIQPKEFQSRYAEDGNPIPLVMQQIPSAMSIPFPVMVAGGNPLGMEDIRWTGATLLPDNGVKLTAALGPGAPPLVFKMYFDAQDKLLRRVEAEITAKGHKSTNLTTLTNVQINPTFAPGTFTFTPAEGAKEIAVPPHFDPKLRLGATPFEIMGKDLQGKAHPWSDYAGKVVLLNFWGPAFQSSLVDLPTIINSYNAYKSAGFEVLGVTVGVDKKTLEAFLKANAITYPQIFDKDAPDAKKYGLTAIPLTLLIGKDGKIAAINPRGRALEPAIIKALAE